jgi:Tol biopolymer transport system component
LTPVALPSIFDTETREEGTMKKLLALIIVGAVAAVVVPDVLANGGTQGHYGLNGQNDHDDDDDGEGEGASCSNDAQCDDGNVCTKDTCKHDHCKNKPVHKHSPCDDGNACTSGDKCDDGVCEGNNTPDGTACSDGDACTQTDSCQSGACTGANPVVCSASDQCHEAGTCDPASGACSDPAAPDGTACDDTDTCSGPDTCQGGVCGLNGDPITRIAFASSRHNPAGGQAVLEIYLMNADATNPVRLTDNLDGDTFPSLSPDGNGRIVFDSNRLRTPSEPFNTSDLFLMKHDGSLQTFLTRGSSATWSPDSKSIVFHRSASGTGLPIRIDAGAPASDSDIFVAKMCDLLAGAPPTNITNSPTEIDDDPAWSPDGQKILWTVHDVGDNPLVIPKQDIYVMNADGSGRVNLTNNVVVEERAPSWSRDGTHIAYMCRVGSPQAPGGPPTFEICVMKADGSGVTRLTNNSVPDGTPTWSPDGTKIVFNRLVAPPAGNQQLFVMNADGSGQAQLTFPPGLNLYSSFGEIKAGP